MARVVEEVEAAGEKLYATSFSQNSFRIILFVTWRQSGQTKYRGTRYKVHAPHTTSEGTADRWASAAGREFLRFRGAVSSDMYLPRMVALKFAGTIWTGYLTAGSQIFTSVGDCRLVYATVPTAQGYSRVFPLYQTPLANTPSAWVICKGSVSSLLTLSRSLPPENSPPAVLLDGGAVQVPVLYLMRFSNQIGGCDDGDDECDDSIFYAGIHSFNYFNSKTCSIYFLHQEIIHNELSK